MVARSMLACVDGGGRCRGRAGVRSAKPRLETCGKQEADGHKKHELGEEEAGALSIERLLEVLCLPPRQIPPQLHSRTFCPRGRPVDVALHSELEAVPLLLAQKVLRLEAGGGAAHEFGAPTPVDLSRSPQLAIRGDTAVEKADHDEGAKQSERHPQAPVVLDLVGEGRDERYRDACEPRERTHLSREERTRIAEAVTLLYGGRVCEFKCRALIRLWGVGD